MSTMLIAQEGEAIRSAREEAPTPELRAFADCVIEAPEEGAGEAESLPTRPERFVPRYRSAYPRNP